MASYGFMVWRNLPSTRHLLIKCLFPSLFQDILTVKMMLSVSTQLTGSISNFSYLNLEHQMSRNNQVNWYKWSKNNAGTWLVITSHQTPWDSSHGHTGTILISTLMRNINARRNELWSLSRGSRRTGTNGASLAWKVMKVIIKTKKPTQCSARWSSSQSVLLSAFCLLSPPNIFSII